MSCSLGRAVLQKRIMALLRKIEQTTQGNKQAWEDTFMNWENTTKGLVNYPKTKLEEGMMGDSLHRTVKRRTSHQSTEHELEVQTGICGVSVYFFIPTLGGSLSRVLTWWNAGHKSSDQSCVPFH